MLHRCLSYLKMGLLLDLNKTISESFTFRISIGNLQQVLENFGTAIVLRRIWKISKCHIMKRYWFLLVNITGKQNYNTVLILDLIKRQNNLYIISPNSFLEKQKKQKHQETLNTIKSFKILDLEMSELAFSETRANLKR